MKTNSVTLIMTVLAAIVIAASATAEIPLSASPVWQHEYGNYPTGIGWSDINDNGWLDLVLANGIDVIGAPNVVYFNGPGGLAESRGWTSHDYGTFCVVAIGDLNSDGAPDLIVPSLGFTPDFAADRHVIYYNRGERFPDTPDWYSPLANSFDCAIGDPDGDGDLDIAFAQGMAVTKDSQKVVIYENVDGYFGQSPVWESDARYFGTDVVFIDIDLDGDQDLTLGANGVGAAVFYNNDGILETTPSFKTDSIGCGRQIAFGDFDSDGYPDLTIAAGPEGFILLKNVDGRLEQEPVWKCDLYQQASCVAWADADGDGDLDLAAGAWWGPAGVFENTNGSLPGGYSWAYSIKGWGQQVVWADYDSDGVKETVQTIPGDGATALFSMKYRPVHDVTSIRIDGVDLDLKAYCYDPLEGWLSLKEPVAEGSVLEIAYSYSTDYDLTITGREAYLFENLSGQNRPGKVEVLMLVDDGLGANYDIDDTSMSIYEQLRGYDWNITTAGLTRTVERCDYSKKLGLTPLTVDYLLSEITDIGHYDLVCMPPNNTGMANYLDNAAALQFVNAAADSGLVVAAWCRTVRVLAAAGLIDGLDVVGHADYADAYAEAGATFLGNDHPPVIQGNIVTSVRGRFYRREMCEAMRDALPPTGFRTMHHKPASEADHVPISITSQVSDASGVSAVELHADTGAGFFTIAMFDDGKHGDREKGDGMYGCTIPNVARSTILRYYVHMTDSIGISATDPREAPVRYYRR